MASQKEIAAKLKAELGEGAELTVLEGIKEEIVQERKANEEVLRQMINGKGTLVSVPGSEVYLYEDDNMQLMYCNNSVRPSKISYCLVTKVFDVPSTSQTLITSQGYVVTLIPRIAFSFTLNALKAYEKIILDKTARVKDLEKEIAPLRYIDALLKKYKEDTK